MQGLQDLLASLHDKGVNVWIADGQLRFQALKGALLPAELGQLRTQKAEIIDLLERTELATTIPIQPRAPGCPVPLTAVQLRAWNYYRKQAKPLSVRMCTLAVHILGSLNVTRLQESIAAVVNRHESLRTKFVIADGAPRQCIDSRCEGSVELINLSDVALPIARDRASRIAEECANEKIDLSEGRLFEAKLLKLSCTEHVLILALDHMITDGVSNQILSRDLWTLYNQAVQGQPSLLPHLPIQFGDYAVWQQQTYGVWLQNHQTYWRNRLTGMSPIQLPSENSLKAVEKPVGAALQVQFESTLTVKLRELGRREGTMLPLVVLTVYVAVMARWCGRRDLLLTFVSNARHRTELENMVGFLASQMYLRIEVQEGDSFLELMKRISEEFYSAYDHMDYDRVPDLIPGCTTDLHFNWLPMNWARLSTDCLPGPDEQLRLLPLNVEVHLLFKFATWITESTHGIEATVRYRPDLFLPETVAWYGRSLRMLAEQFANCPSGRISSAWRSSGQ